MIFRTNESINYKQKLSDVNVKLRYNSEMFIFEWDEDKAKTNLRKHKVSFEEAETIFDDHFLITFPDESHSIEEERFISIGYSIINRILLVVHTEYSEDAEANIIRIISCRKATVLEREVYEQKKNEGK